MPPFLERINYKKVVTVLASVFGIALGLCGLNLLAYSAARMETFLGGVLFLTAVIELAAIVISAGGLIVISILWAIGQCIEGFDPERGSSEPQRLFEDANDNSRASNQQENKND